MVTSQREAVGIVRQPVLDTGVTPTFLMPVTPGSFTANESHESIIDNGRRGINSMDFAAIQGVAITEISWDGIVQDGNATQNNGLGLLIQNLLETAVYVAVDNGGTVFDHFLKLGTLKSYLTLEHTLFQDANDRRFINARVTELSIQYNRAEGGVTYSVTLMGHFDSVGGLVTAASLTDNTGDQFRGWEGLVTFDGGTTFARLMSGDLTVAREGMPIYSSGNDQNYTDLIFGPLEVTGSLVFDLGAADLAALRSKSQGALTVIFTKGTADAVSERSFGYASIDTDYGDGPYEIDVSQVNSRLNISYRGLYSTTNGPLSAAAQNGPIEFQLTQELQTEFTD